MNLFNEIFRYISLLNIKVNIMPLLYVCNIPKTYINNLEYDIFSVRLFIYNYRNTNKIVQNMYNVAEYISQALVINYTDLINLYVLNREILEYILRRNIEIVHFIYNRKINHLNICNIDIDILSNHKFHYKELVFFSNFLNENNKLQLITSLAHNNDSSKIDNIYSFLNHKFIDNNNNSYSISYENKSELHRLVKHYNFNYVINKIDEYIVSNSKVINTDEYDVLVFLLINIHLNMYTSKNNIIICSEDIRQLITNKLSYSSFNNYLKRTLFVISNNYTEIYKLTEFLSYSNSQFIHIVFNNKDQLEFLKIILSISRYNNREFIVYNLTDINITNLVY